MTFQLTRSTTKRCSTRSMTLGRYPNQTTDKVSLTISVTTETAALSLVTIMGPSISSSSSSSGIDGPKSVGARTLDDDAALPLLLCPLLIELIRELNELCSTDCSVMGASSCALRGTETPARSYVRVREGGGDGARGGCFCRDLDDLLLDDLTLDCCC